jgi:predicted phosphoribosyltransferase
MRIQTMEEDAKLKCKKESRLTNINPAIDGIEAGRESGPLFRDREDAGRRLATQLERCRAERPVVLALPRGGVPVAARVALALQAPLGVLPVRKIGVPGHRELGVGAIAKGGAPVIDWHAVRELRISIEDLNAVISDERTELERQERAFVGEAVEPSLDGSTVIIVDDGLATGMSALAAVRSVRARGAGRIVLAVPVGAPETITMLRSQVDALVCLAAPAHFRAVGLWYSNFDQTSDATVVELLADARKRMEAHAKC